MYFEDRDSRPALIAKAEKRRGSSAQVAPAFVENISSCRRDHERFGAVTSAGVGRLNEGAGRASDERSDTSTLADPLHMFCSELGVDVEAFFRREVCGHKTIMSHWKEAAKMYTVFQKERRLYQTTSCFQWKRSELQSSLAFIDSQTTKIGNVMREVNAVTINPALLLTAAGSVSLSTKIRLLAELSGILGAFRDRLENAIQRLQCRNAQIRARGMPQPNQVVLNCLNCPEMTWLEATTKLKDAAAGELQVGAPLSAEQLLECARLLQSTNVLPLRDLLAAVDVAADNSDHHFSGNAGEQLLMHLPVLSVRRSSAQWVLVNMAEFALFATSHTFADILLLENHGQ